MKALFNGDCYGCRKFRPRCAVVLFHNQGRRSGVPYAITQRLTLCDQCRASQDYKGRFTLDERHR